MADPPAFLADAMLGRLARWLRVLGFDAAYDTTLPDAELVRWAAREHRVLLTRDRRLMAELRPEPALLIEADRPLDQLRQVVAHFDLTPPAPLFTRCLLCNAPLREATPAEVAQHVPLDAKQSPEPVRRCPACERLYWHGSHTRRMREALHHALPEWKDEAGSLDGRLC